jgi:hypothetical protein
MSDQLYINPSQLNNKDWLYGSNAVVFIPE